MTARKAERKVRARESASTVRSSETGAAGTSALKKAVQKALEFTWALKGHIRAAAKQYGVYLLVSAQHLDVEATDPAGLPCRSRVRPAAWSARPRPHPRSRGRPARS